MSNMLLICLVLFFGNCDSQSRDNIKVKVSLYVPSKCDSLAIEAISMNKALAVSNLRIKSINKYRIKAGVDKKKWNTLKNESTGKTSLLMDSISYSLSLISASPTKLNVNVSCDSIKKIRDSIRIALTRANFKVIRVRYYLNITRKRPDKFSVFFRGWLNGLF